MTDREQRAVDLALLDEMKEGAAMTMSTTSNTA
jgi:hypothetical protein